MFSQLRVWDFLKRKKITQKLKVMGVTCPVPDSRRQLLKKLTPSQGYPTMHHVRSADKNLGHVTLAARDRHRESTVLFLRAVKGSQCTQMKSASEKETDKGREQEAVGYFYIHLQRGLCKF